MNTATFVQITRGEAETLGVETGATFYVRPAGGMVMTVR
jgi:hypothetical protein